MSAPYRLRARTALITTTRIPAEWREVALDLPCGHPLDGLRCGAEPTRLYPRGRRCVVHAPAAITTTRKDSRG